MLFPLEHPALTTPFKSMGLSLSPHFGYPNLHLVLHLFAFYPPTGRIVLIVFPNHIINNKKIPLGPLAGIPLTLFIFHFRVILFI